MKPMVSKKKRVLSLAFAVMMMVSLSILPAVSVDASVGGNIPTHTNVHIHALHFPADTVVTINGDGKQIHEIPEGAEPLEGADYIMLEVKPSDSLSMYPSTAEAAAFYEAHKADDSYRKYTGTTDGSGTWNVANVESGNYLVYQTNIAPATTMAAAPVVLSLPQMLPDGTGWNNDLHLYTKLNSTLGAATLYKFDGEKGSEHALSGATFSVFMVDDVKGALPIATDLVTGRDGFTPVVNNLLPGNYYFVETSAPEGYLVSYQQYKFTITENAYEVGGELDNDKVVKVGTESDPQGNKVANYKAPTLDKALQTDSSADIGEANTWSITASLPMNIEEYSSFVVTDQLDNRLTYAGGLQVQAKIDGTLKTIDQSLYTVGFPADSPTNTLTVTLTAPLTVLTEATELVVTFSTNMNGNETPDAEIPNTALLNYNNGYVGGQVKSYHSPYVLTGGRKFLKTDSYNKPLQGAKFVVYQEVNGVTTYMKQDSSMSVSWVADLNQATTFASAEDGSFQLVGLGYGTYFLKETVTPEGYNPLASDYKFTVATGSYDSNNQIVIVNANLPIIPVTGGMGTVLFYVGGALLMGVAAFVLIKSRKKTEEVHNK